MKTVNLFWFATTALFLIGIALLPGCSRAHGREGAKAERVFTDQAGYVCFIVRDDDGKGVGGNCLRE